MNNRITAFGIMLRVRQKLLKLVGRNSAVGKAILHFGGPNPETVAREYQVLGPETAYRACSALESIGIRAWLCSGSLLGVVRDGHFLPWDDDLDLFVVMDEGFSWVEAERVLTEVGYPKVREFTLDGKVTEQAYGFGQFSHFDLFGMNPVGEDKVKGYFYTRFDDVWYPDRSWLTPMTYEMDSPSGIEYVEVEGWKLPIPQNAETILEYNYGPNWRIPDPDFTTGSTFSRMDGVFGRCNMRLR